MSAGSEPLEELPASSSRSPSETQSAILNATLEIMRDVGDSGVRVAKVARKAGVTTGAIYSNFGSREGLIAAAHIAYMEREISRLIQPHDAVVHRSDRDPTHEDLWSTPDVDFSQPMRLEMRRWAEAGLLAHRNPEVAKALIPIARRAMDAIVDRIIEDQKRGWRRADLDPRAMAVLLVGAGMGAAIMAGVYSPDQPDIGDRLHEAWPDIATAFMVERPPRPATESSDYEV